MEGGRWTRVKSPAVSLQCWSRFVLFAVGDVSRRIGDDHWSLSLSIETQADQTMAASDERH